MQMRGFGRTGMQVSVLGFGCGAVGGFMVRGDPAAQERTVARAIEAGVNYFDTAVQYGNGESEKNLGRVLRSLKPAKAIVGTKVRLPPPTSAASKMLWQHRLRAVWRDCVLSKSISSTCTIRSPSRAAERR